MIGSIIKSWQFYGYAVIQLLIEPRRFFTDLPGNTTFLKSFGFCLICSLFFVLAGLLTGSYTDPVQMGGVFFINSMGMVFISAGLSFMIMVMTLGRKVGFSLIFSIYAFSSGIVLLISWMSFFFWFTEPWKWWLVFTGLKHAGRFSWKPALLVLILTMIIQFAFMYSLYLAFYK